MKKIIALLTTICLSSTVLVGCDNKGATQDNKEKTTQSSKPTEDKKEPKLEHNLKEAGDLARDFLTFNFNNIDINKKTTPRNLPGFLFTLPSHKENVKKISSKKYQDGIKVVYLKDAVDVYNTYNKKIYNEEDVLKDINNVLYANKGIFYKQVDKAASELSDDEIRAIFDVDQMIVYFKKDKAFAYNISIAIGGASPFKEEPQSDWKVTDNSVEIPFINPQNNKVEYVVILKLNDKKYVGGRKNSLYYYEDVKNKES